MSSIEMFETIYRNPNERPKFYYNDKPETYDSMDRENVIITSGVVDWACVIDFYYINGDVIYAEVISAVKEKSDKEKIKDLEARLKTLEEKVI